MTKTIGRKTVLASFALTAIAGGVIAGQNLLTTPNTAQAITPPDSCFAFNAGTGAITDYYDNEANSMINPACPKDVDIPSSIDGVAVVSIGSFAFSSNQLTSVTIPNGVTSIGGSAFQANQFNSITIPSSATTFGNDIFNFTPLTSITYGSTTYSSTDPIAEQCFTFATGSITNYLYLDMNLIKNSGVGCLATDVTIPSTIGGVAVTRIGAAAFYGNSLTSVTIPSGVTRIYDWAFSGNQLNSINIPSSVTNIGRSAFASNQFTSVTVPSTVTIFGTDVFNHNPLTSITYGSTTYSSTDPIAEQCFTFATGSITNYLYLDMNLIKNSGVGCLATDVTIPSTIGGVQVVNIGDYAFAANHLTNVIIPNGVVTIGQSAFNDNELTSVIIPNSVATVGNSAFYSNKLTSVTVSESMTRIEDGVFNENKITSLTIPSSVTSIGYGTFYDNQLTSLTIPSTVTSIEDNAFSYNQLTTLAIPDTVTSIGSYAFSDNQLTSLTLPDALATINSGTFSSNKLTSVIMPNTVTAIGSYAFSSNLLASVTIPSGVAVIGSYAFSDNQLTSISIPNSVTSVGNSAFAYNYLNSVALSNNLIAIGVRVFYGNKLNSVIIPNAVASIDQSAFALQTPWGKDIKYGNGDGPRIESSDPTEIQQIYSNVWFAQIYTENPSNPNNIVNANLSEQSLLGSDKNGNGITDDSLGGHIVNPASAETKYMSNRGEQLDTPVFATGTKPDTTQLTSYLAAETTIPAPLDPYAITPEEQAVMDAGFAQYYKLGDEVTLTAPATLAGLPLLRPASPHSLQLTQPVNTVNFIYGTPLRTIDFATPVGSATNPTANSVPSSVTPLLAKSVFSVSDAKACSQIQSASLIAAADFTAPQTGQDVLGGLSFTIDCTASGGQADVSFALGGTITDLTGVKVYKQDSISTITDITDQVTLTNQSTPDGTRTTISYSVTDGEALDDDGLVNGTIVDPIYLTAPTGTSFSLLGASSSSSEALAATGVNIWLTTATALLLLVTGTVTAIQTTQRKQTQ